MNLRSFFLVSASNPTTSRLRLLNSALADSLSRMRMTESSRNGRHDRDAEVDRAPAHAELEAAVLRDALLGDVELRHDLMREMMVPWCRLSIGPWLVQDAVDAVLDEDHVFLGLDVDVGGAPLDRVEHDESTELDDGRGILRDRSIVRVSSPSSSSGPAASGSPRSPRRGRAARHSLFWRMSAIAARLRP